MLEPKPEMPSNTAIDSALRSLGAYEKLPYHVELS